SFDAWDRNLCADLADRNRCIFRSRRRTGTCELSARLFCRGPFSCAEVSAARLSTQAQSEQARVSVIEELLDRGYGKATQPIAGDKDADAIRVETSVNMTEVAKLLLTKLAETSG